MMRSKSFCGMLVACLCLSMTIATAAPKEKGKGQKKKGGNTPFTLKLPKTIELTAEQKTKVAGIQKEFASQAKEQQQIINSILTPELRKARGEAMKQARESGKKGKDLKAAVDASLSSLSAEDKAKYEAALKANAEIRKNFFAAVKPILTEEQAAQLPQRKGKGKPSGEKKKKQKQQT